MANKTYIIHGIAHWAKVLGPPRENEYTGGREWSIDLTPDKEGRKLLKELGLSDRLREPKGKDTRKETFLSFRHRELMSDGSKAERIRVVNADAEPWSDQDGLIGNGSEVNIKFVVRDYGKGKKKGMYIRAVQVVNLVPYVIRDFDPVDGDDEDQDFSSDEDDTPRSAGLKDKFGTVQDELDALDDDMPE